MSRSAPHERAPLTLDRETTGEAVEVFDGLWILATRHHGGGFSRFPEANNRAIILRLVDADTGRAGLVVVNATDPAQSFAPLHRLREQTGLEVSHVVSPSGGHHSFMGPWHDEFSAATLWLGAERIPRTANGARLLRRPRVALMDPADPLPQFRGQLDAMSFTGLLGPGEFESPTESGRDSLWATIKAMRQLVWPTDPYDELWLRHVASQTLIGGENLAPYFSRQAHAAMPWLVRRAIAPEVVTVTRKVADPQLVARTWAAVLAWPAKTLLGYHDSVGSGFVGDVPEALRRAAIAARQLRPQRR